MNAEVPEFRDFPASFDVGELQPLQDNIGDSFLRQVSRPGQSSRYLRLLRQINVRRQIVRFHGEQSRCRQRLLVEVRRARQLTVDYLRIVVQIMIDIMMEGCVWSRQGPVNAEEKY